MLRVDNINTLNLQVIKGTSHATGQVSHPRSVASMAASELANVRAEAITETMEELSLGLSRHLKSLGIDKEVDDPRLSSLTQLVKKLSDAQATTLNALCDNLLRLNDGDKMLAQLKHMGLDTGQMMLLMMSLLMSGQLSESARKKMTQVLKDSLAVEGAEIALFAALDGLPLDKAGLNALQQLYQQAAKGDAGLAKWFNLLKDMPDRRHRIRVLLRALSEPLNEHRSDTDMVKVAAVVGDLRRLLLFLTLEEHCNLLARVTQLEGEQVLQLTLQLIDQAWLNQQWLEAHICQLPLLPARRLGFLRRWRELLGIIPLDCFRSPEQKLHIDTTMLDLLDIWNDQE